MKILASIAGRFTCTGAEALNNSTFPFFSNRRYLMRLALTAVVFIITPLIAWFSIVFYQSYNEIINAREDYYLEITRSFGVSFQREIAEKLATAIQISVDSRDSRNDSFALSSALFSQNAYYYTECIRAVAQYSKLTRSRLGIYFPSEDSLFTDTYKFSADSFIANYLNIMDSEAATKIKNSFIKAHEQSLYFVSTYPEMGSEGILLLVIPIRLGLQRESALVFFIFNDSFIDSLYFSEKSLEFCIFDSHYNELLYSSGVYFPENPHQMLAGSRTFIIEDGAMGLTYTTIVPFDRITSSLNNFFEAMKNIGIIAFIALIFIIASMIYINYKPIEKYTNEMSKREQLTMDLLLGQLLYGIPIPRNEAEQLGLAPPQGGCFCVIVLFGIQLSIDDLTNLRSVFSSNLGVTSYSTDILYRDHTVIVCLLPSSEMTGIKEYLEPVIGEGHFEIGPAVNQLINIKDSYEACLKQDTEMNSSAKLSADLPRSKLEKDHANQYAQDFRDKILKFVEDQFNNPQLGLKLVADHFGISIYSVSRVFNNEIGVGFSEFITAKRMALAQSLLLSTEKGIVEIASAVGMPNVNYFSRLFKSFYGTIPTKYRNEWQP